MAQFPSDLFVLKLRKLNSTQESIESLSFYMQHHRRHSEKAVLLWNSEMKQSNAFHQGFLPN
jgi:hypothetical protein